jgi:hypothetical protein
MALVGACCQRHASCLPRACLQGSPDAGARGILDLLGACREAGVQLSVQGMHDLQEVSHQACWAGLPPCSDPPASPAPLCVSLSLCPPAALSSCTTLPLPTPSSLLAWQPPRHAPTTDPPSPSPTRRPRSASRPQALADAMPDLAPATALAILAARRGPGAALASPRLQAAVEAAVRAQDDSAWDGDAVAGAMTALAASQRGGEPNKLDRRWGRWEAASGLQRGRLSVASWGPGGRRVARLP